VTNAVRARNGVGRDERVASSVLKIAGCWVEFVDSGPMSHPFEVDEAARVVLRCEGLYVEVLVGDIVAIGAEAVASRTQELGLDRRMIVDCSAGGPKGSDAVGEPERGFFIC
jgi:hypothetical protein